MKRDFLTVAALSPAELTEVLDLADALRADRRPRRDLAGRAVALIFAKPSTRTRVSFEVGIAELGGTAVTLRADELQLGRGETVADTARVLSGYVHAVVVRTSAQSLLEELAAHGAIPVVNALTDVAHPCQALADLQTIRAHFGRLAGLRLAYLGDGNNVAHSLAEAGALAGMHVRVASPRAYAPDARVIADARAIAARTGGSVEVLTDPLEAATGAEVLATDVWASMGDEHEHAARVNALGGYQLNAEVLARATAQAVVLHCLPAHRGEEITADVLDGPHSLVWTQAENRLHAQKALLLFLLGHVGAPS